MEKRLLAILRLAIKVNATDIHFNRKYNDTQIMMRVDNVPKKVKSEIGDDKLIRYLQYLSNLDVGNLTTPQTGQFELEVDGNILSLRFAIINNPTYTNAVLRILNANLKIEADSLSEVKNQNEYFKSLFENRNGLILFSGPTGSGKTTTLYTLLKSVQNKIIFTIEDPIEVYNDNLVQLQVNEKIGFDYEAGIRQILRHDPDIIMIGEIRDTKAAKMAVTAANTGHLVLSTIHASSASSIISRMEGLGVRKDELYEVLLCLSNQAMLVDKEGNKKVIYEIMNKKEINYFRENGFNSLDFKTVDYQINKGKEDGIY